MGTVPKPCNVSADDLLHRVRDAFRDDLGDPPPLTLRGANAIDGYDRPEPFDPAADEPTDEYLEEYAFWGLSYLDATSWRHYLPRLIEYTLTHADDPRMVGEALIRSLRAPDRYPPRLASLPPDQDAVVAAFLDRLCSRTPGSPLADDARQALTEWFGPNPTHRPTAEAMAADRRRPAVYRARDGGAFTIHLPETLTGGDAREIPEESRRAIAWSGYLCADAHTTVTTNIWPLAARSMATAIDRLSTFYRSAISPRPVAVRGADAAQRFDGLVDGDSPAEPRHLTLIVAQNRHNLFVLTVRAWPRDDVVREVDRIAGSFELAPVS